MSRSTTLIRRWFGVTTFDAHPLLLTDTAAVWDVVCQGACKHKGAEEWAAATHLVFPYRGVYVHHVGRTEAVAEANQVVCINEDESYRVQPSGRRRQFKLVDCRQRGDAV